LLYDIDIEVGTWKLNESVHSLLKLAFATNSEWQ